MTMRRVLVIGALAALALAACGGDDGDSGSSPSGNGGNGGNGTADAPSSGGGDVDACELLTTEEVEAAVGNPVADGRADIANSCNWDADTGFYAGTLVLAAGTKDQCVAALETDDTYTEASDIADGAFTTYNPNVGGTASVTTCTDKGQVTVDVYGYDDPADEQHLRTASEELARQALARL
jgi:hypothetical protein